MKKLQAILIAVVFALGAHARSDISENENVGASESSLISELEFEAHSGDTEAMNYLGYLLMSGAEGIEKDAAAGLSWITKAASLGDVKAASNLGWLFIEGSLVEQDYSEGARWLSKASQAGLPVAQSLLGDLYRDGKGVAPDSAKADSLYREAFERGLADAGYKLFALHSGEYAEMTPTELVETGKYYYLRGAPSEGVKLFYMASDAGDADAMALLGDAYTRAMGVPYDYDLSLSYYVKAAKAGNPSAQFILGELLEIFPDTLRKISESEGVPEDAEYWMKEAASAGVTDAEEAARRLF